MTLLIYALPIGLILGIFAGAIQRVALNDGDGGSAGGGAPAPWAE